MIDVAPQVALNGTATDVDGLQAIRLLHARGWRRTYARRETGPETTITLVYEKGDELPLRVDVLAPATRDTQVTDDGESPAIVSCMDDVALPTLRQACAAYDCQRIVRYRPGKRCTFRGIQDGAPVYVKVLADDRGAQIAAEAAVLQQHRHSFEFAIADCLGWDGGLRALVHAETPGDSVHTVMLTRNAADVAGRIGQALPSLSLSDLAPGPTFTARDQIQRTKKYAKKFIKATPRLAPVIHSFVDALEQGHAQTPDTPLRPIHGSPHPHQWLQRADGRLALIDFDRVSMGPVEIDAATFVAELDFEAGGMPEAAQAFLSAYSARVSGIDDRLLALYRAHKHFAKAFKCALSLDEDRNARAERILAGGRDLLKAAST